MEELQIKLEADAKGAVGELDTQCFRCSPWSPAWWRLRAGEEVVAASGARANLVPFMLDAGLAALLAAVPGESARK